MAKALVAIGGNRGARSAVLEGALASLGRLPGTRLVRRSRLIETPPERPADGPPFLNAAALLETELQPEPLLRELLALERRAGRQRVPGRKGGPRPLDLDLVLWEGRVVRAPGLELPHPRFRGRRFVLEPAAEVAPAMRDPISRRTVAELRSALEGKRA